MKVALGMSGGVDSSVSAALLVSQGHEVTGVFLECWRAPGCRVDEDRKDALSVALKLGIPFQVLDFKETYRQKVVEYFFEEYQNGRTPNPDVLCNKEIKFGLFYDWAMENGFDAIATGHYAQIQRLEVRGQEEDDISNLKPLASSLFLIRSKDSKKDQTYFLYRLRQEQLAHVLFPIGHLTKSEVRALAVNHDIPVAAKPDSQGICFIGEINVHGFLKDRLGENPGEVVDTKGRVIGKHTGLWFYTIGQRHGFTIDVNPFTDETTKHSMPPLYVISKDPKHNRLIVGIGVETLQTSFAIETPHWIAGQPPQRLDLQVRVRHTGQLYKGRLSTDYTTVELNEAAGGIAPGQSAVFYQDQVCLGGAVITSK